MEDLKQNFTCKLTAPELQKRRATVIRELKDLMVGREESVNGFKYIFPGDDLVLDKIVAFIKSERLCCDFFLFRLLIEGSKAILEVTGPDGSKEFLDYEVGL